MAQVVGLGGFGTAYAVSPLSVTISTNGVSNHETDAKRFYFD